MYNSVGRRFELSSPARLFLCNSLKYFNKANLKSSKSPFRSIVVALGLSLAAGLPVWVLWIEGFLGPLQQAFVVLPADPVDGGLGAYFISVYAGRSDARAPYHIHTKLLAQ